MKYRIKSVYKKISLFQLLDFIKYERNRLGYTYAKMSKLSGLSKSTCYRIINGGNPTLTSLIKIYRAFGYNLVIAPKAIKINKNI